MMILARREELLCKLQKRKRNGEDNDTPTSLHSTYFYYFNIFFLIYRVKHILVFYNKREAQLIHDNKRELLLEPPEFKK
jgi:hypothetical protein